MSWLKENYEKAALGGAAAILVGVVATNFLGGDKGVSEDALSVEVNNDPGEELLNEMTKVLAVRKDPAGIRPKPVDGREVDLFIGQPLYMAEGSEDPIDIYDAAPVHQGIPNEWWRKYEIDPSFANADLRDHDKDGFTNREEFDAQTHPGDASSHPSPLMKVVGNDVDLFKMQMRWSSFDQNSITLYYQDNKRVRFSERVNHGDGFFQREGEAFQKRFVLGSESVKVTDPSGREQDAYVVEDTTPRFKGTPKQKFTLFRRGPKPQGYNEIQDRSVTLTLHALGQEGSSFEVKELERFSLPYDAKAKIKPYQVTKIEPVAGQKNVFTVEIVGESESGPTSKTLTVRMK